MTHEDVEQILGPGGSYGWDHGRPGHVTFGAVIGQSYFRSWETEDAEIWLQFSGHWVTPGKRLTEHVLSKSRREHSNPYRWQGVHEMVWLTVAGGLIGFAFICKGLVRPRRRPNLWPCEMAPAGATSGSSVG
jgi:hypothetical protein